MEKYMMNGHNYVWFILRTYNGNCWNGMEDNWEMNNLNGIIIKFELI